MKIYLSIFSILICSFCEAQINKTYTVKGVERKAILYEPQTKTANTPVIFFFHGHGGNAKHAARNYKFYYEYKESLVIYMEGIPGRTSRVDAEGKMNGWQHFPDDLGNRDVIFFDTVLASIKRNYSIDTNRVYIAGHSNGARFVNVLWVERPETIAAICSVAAQGGMMIRNAKPISIWVSMGKKDPIVPYKNQKLSIPIIKKNLGIESSGVKTNGEITNYTGIKGTELVVQERDAGHDFPTTSIPEIVAFFKRQVKKL